MILQISSGMGPVECRSAVGGIYRALETEFADLEMIASMKGEVEGAFSSIIFSSEQDLSELVGTMQWIFKSKHRPGHKRKNQFVDVSIIPDAEEIDSKLTVILKEMNVTNKDKQRNDAWSKHAQIVRGNPVRIYEGEDFKLTYIRYEDVTIHGLMTD